VYLI
jgi:hypothetical protein